MRYKCKAIGSGSEGAQSTLQEGYSESLTLAEAEALAVSTLKQVGKRKDEELIVRGKDGYIRRCAVLLELCCPFYL